MPSFTLEYLVLRLQLGFFQAKNLSVLSDHENTGPVFKALSMWPVMLSSLLLTNRYTNENVGH